MGELAVGLERLAAVGMVGGRAGREGETGKPGAFSGSVRGHVKVATLPAIPSAKQDDTLLGLPAIRALAILGLDAGRLRGGELIDRVVALLAR